MARIYPFRAWRFNPSLVRLSDVATQPGDKISPALQQAYYQRSPYNLVRITLGLPELFDSERGETTCTRAARDFNAWRQQGVLHHEKEFCVFAYAQRFAVPNSDTIPSGTRMERRGFIALGKLYDYADQVVFRHQETPPQPGISQLNLLRSTHAQFDPILMLYSDPARSVERILYDDNGPADFEITDENDVQHSLWKITDPAVIRLLTAAMADKKLILADGQDRYEAALAYSTEHTHPSHATSEHNPSQLPQPPTPDSAALMTFVNMDAEGLVILRTLRGPAEAIAQVRRGPADRAFLNNTVTIDQIREAAFAGKLMPPNSTAFFPNLLSGLAIYALE